MQVKILRENHHHITLEIVGLSEAINFLSQINSKLDKIMAQNEEINAGLDELGTSLDNIAADIAKLSATGTPGLTQEQADAIVARVRAVAAAAKTIADTTPDA